MRRNVIKGEMSIIGPRPEITSITDNYNLEQREVFNYKPGITGISQINGRQMLTPDKRIEMEIDYYKRATIKSNLKIFLRTFKVVLSNEGNVWARNFLAWYFFRTLINQIEIVISYWEL